MTNPRLNATLRVLGFSALTAAFFSYFPANDSSSVFSGAACAAAENEVREWTDSTGKFKVQAALISQDANGVKLRKTNGRVVTLPFSKLSKEDIEYLGDLEKAEDADNPFAGGTVDEDESDGSAAETESDGGVVADGSFKIGGKSKRFDSRSGSINLGDLSDAKSISAPLKAEWKVKLEAPKRKPLEPLRGIRLGAGFDRFAFLTDFVLAASSAEASEIYVGYDTGAGSDRQDYVERCDLLSGSSSTIELSGVNATLTDVSPDGKYALTIQDMSKKIAGQDKECLLGIYPLDKAKWGSKSALKPVALFYPYAEKTDTFDKQLRDARWIDSGHILTRSAHEIACWDLSTGKAVYTISGVGLGRISLDPSRRVLGAVVKNTCALYDPLTGETLGAVSNSGEDNIVNFGACAFSPSGKKFAACFDRSLCVVDATTGAVLTQFEIEASTFEKILWTSEDQLFVGRILYDVELGLPLCNYTDGNVKDAKVELGGLTWFVSIISGRVLVGCAIPHKAALDAKKELGKKDSFALYPGAHVALKVETNGLLDENDVRNRLEKRLEQEGFELDPQSKVVVRGYVVDTKEETEVAYGAADPRFSALPLPPSPFGRRPGNVMGTIKLKVFEEGIEIYDGDKKLSALAAKTVGPQDVKYDPDKKIEDSLRESNVPEIKFFDHAFFPRYLSKSGKRAGMEAHINENGVK